VIRFDRIVACRLCSISGTSWLVIRYSGKTGKPHNTETGTPSNNLPRQVAFFDRNPEMLFAGIPVKRLPGLPG
jgi:hypothetical protein